MAAGERPERWRVLVDGLPFRVLASRGPTDRPPVVLIHGIGVSHRYLARLQTVLSQQRTVYSIDLPGFGGLPKPVHDIDVPTMATTLAKVLDSLHLESVVLVGHSMGSQWVVEVGIQRPDLVSYVVTMGPVTDPRHRSVVAQTIALAKDTLGEPPAVNALVFSDYVRCGIPWYLTQLRHMLSYPIEDRVGSLSRPLLIIRGARDPIAGLDWCRRLRERAPKGDLVLIPGQHHVAQHAAPRAVAAAILAHAP
jgi:pimeloyl-ACP methyl ester carboxylesterase